jgi:hypothetical protein
VLGYGQEDMAMVDRNVFVDAMLDLDRLSSGGRRKGITTRSREFRRRRKVD